MSESRFLKIALVGAGSVATHLGLALKHAGHQVESVLNRNSEHGLALAKKLDARFVEDVAGFNHPDIVIIAVSDDAIPLLVEQLVETGYPVVHTSGTVSKDALSKVGPDYGVFYPLQTFSIGREVDFSNIPVCLDASNAAFNTMLGLLAHSISGTVCQIDESKRKILHLAGVFACNFSNYLYSVADEILKKNDIPFDLLLPLIHETAIKIQTTSPLKAQTGPARRGDQSTLKQHMLQLQNDPMLLDLYQILTDNILKTYLHPFSTAQIQSKTDQ